MYHLLYVEINIICSLILIYILLEGRRNIDKRIENIAFNRIVVATLQILLLDILWVFIEKPNVKAFYYLNMFVNMCFVMQAAIICYLWFAFIEYRLNRGVQFTSKLKWAMRAPVLLLAAVCLLSPWTKWLFYIDESNIYHRGPLHMLQIIISYMYLVVATSHIFINIKKTKDRQIREEYRMLFFIIAAPSLTGIIGARIYGLPITWQMTTLSLLVIYINLQKYQISTDGLTGVNNRRKFDHYLNELLRQEQGKTGIYLYLMDINAFKKINDKYGHVEGDKALIQTATLLRDVCMDKNAFLARYGGDEFSIIYFCQDDAEASQFGEDIKKRFELYNQEQEKEYELTLSVGWSMWQLCQKSSPEQLIKQADKALYEEKIKRKKKSKVDNVSR